MTSVFHINLALFRVWIPGNLSKKRRANQKVASFGSQGQQRSSALSLKLSESEIIKEITGDEPVILLDDVMSELDLTRQDYILNNISGRQVFITCCDPNTVLRLCEGKTFHIKNGGVI